MIFHTLQRRVTAAVAATLVFATVTAFGVDAASDAPDDLATVVESVGSQAQVGTSDQAVFERSERIQRGDTLPALFARLGVQDAAALRFAQTQRAAAELTRPQPGRTLAVETDAEGRLLRLDYTPDVEAAARGERRVVLQRANERFVVRQESVNVVRAANMRAAEIRGPFFAAIDAAGIPESVALQLAEIFGRQVDFHRGVRAGDRLRVVYETLHLEGSLDAPRPGRILAVEFVNGARVHRAMWFERANDGRGEYFGFDGRSLRQGFLRSPLEFSRITSGFSQARVHPVFHDVRAHKGIDYAAPVGTKVRSVGDGTVSFAGTQRGYGNVVVVQHQNEISTLYAHLEGFAAGLRPGQRVQAGEVLGAVGMTGYTTGPHLHFEYRVRGEHVDPLSLDLPSAQPLDAAAKARYEQALSQVRHRLALLEAVRVARFE